jgi:hypothetical protein
LQDHVQKEHDDHQFLNKPKQTVSNITSETKEVELEQKNTVIITSTEEEECVDCEDTSDCIDCIMKHVTEDHTDVTIATYKMCAVRMMCLLYVTAQIAKKSK